MKTPLNQDLYTQLGVKPGATASEIKDAYRSQASKHHPDKGGQTDDFLAVQLAYEVLSDPSRRAKYDETGETKPKRDSVANDAIQLVLKMIGKFEHRYRDVVAKAIKSAEQDASLMRQHAKRKAAVAVELRDAASRFLFDGGENVLAGALNHEADNVERAAAKDEASSVHLLKVAEYLNSYGYRIDEQPRFQDVYGLPKGKQ